MRVNLTETEKSALRDLLYLVTHDEALNARVLADYKAARCGNPDMLATSDFGAALEALYAKGCR